MSSTLRTPVRVESVPRIADSPSAMEQLRDGLSNATAQLSVPGLDAVYDRAHEEGLDGEPDAARPWDHLLDEVVADVALQVAPLLDAAIARRLPWDWPER